MADKTGIGWTNATWNPLVGCSIVSPGCTNCYAMKQANRIERMAEGADRESHYAGTTKLVKGKAVWTGAMKKAPEHILTQPLRWTEPRMIFANSMSDLFHEDVPDEWIDEVFAVMALSPRHTFQVLTKRAGRMRQYLSGNRFSEGHASERIGYAAMALVDRATGGDETKRAPWPYDPRIASWLIHGPTPDSPNVAFPRPEIWPLPNVWLGVSTEDQARADERVDLLLDTPAAVRFASYEPAIGRVDFTRITIRDDDPPSHFYVDSLRGSVWDDENGEIEPAGAGAALDWIIVGGESGPSARAFHLDWARQTVRDCAEAGVAVFVKQLGSNPADTSDEGTFGVYTKHRKGEDMAEWPESIRVQEWPKGDG